MDKMNHTCLAKVSWPSVAGGKKSVQCVAFGTRVEEAGLAGDALFTVTMTEYWHGLTREDMESPSLGILRTQLDMAQSNLLYVSDHALGRWLDEMIPRGLFQPSGMSTYLEHGSFCQCTLGQHDPQDSYWAVCAGPLTHASS